ncbi:GIY-YIG nuclease family protein [Sphingomonas sp. ID1715]|uniref:GIY-YIG nuclease family protein n=1 Tax=Sphingomonas sp. ID1715 TaxID=1656898 RepID=UPI0020C421D6|nr:GIY-YIG nuclease family protein [Sphingomonas sp. ID1715]
MSFWTYMIQCGDRTLYVGHTNNLDQRWAEHQHRTFKGYTASRHPLHLVWSQEFGTRDEALEAERQIKGWGRAKKLALIRGDWALISALGRSLRQEEGRASTSSAQTDLGTAFLHPHSALLPSQPFSIEARLALGKNKARVGFTLSGAVDLLLVPTRSPAARRDNLWQHTCFELFARTWTGYIEYNLSLSTEWAAYAFSGYRENMSQLAVEPPGIRVERSAHRLQLTAELDLPAEATDIGLSAVIEELDGTKSYWALRHPPGERPDFHHPDCFALELPSAGEA